MKYPVYVYGSSALRKGTKEITKDYEGLDKLIEDMFETMYASDGVGLAAPQIGKNARLFVVDTSPLEDDPEADGFKCALINAEIYEYGEEGEYFEEGCLSVPGIHEDVIRPSVIKMRYMNADFEEKDETFSGYAARVIQHEYDHLEGKMFVDRVSPLRRQLIKSKLDKIAKGDFKSVFPCKLVK
ncbi:MAG: peptide deformylase [Rikenellaceae bacterium]